MWKEQNKVQLLYSKDLNTMEVELVHFSDITFCL